MVVLTHAKNIVRLWGSSSSSPQKNVEQQLLTIIVSPKTIGTVNSYSIRQYFEILWVSGFCFSIFVGLALKTVKQPATQRHGDPHLNDDFFFAAWSVHLAQRPYKSCCGFKDGFNGKYTSLYFQCIDGISLKPVMNYVGLGNLGRTSIGSANLLHAHSFA